MRTLKNVSLVAVLGLLLSAGCSSPPAEGSPGWVVQQFYDHLNAERYDDAKALYGEESRAVVSDPDSAADYAKWAQGETKSGTISAVAIVNVEEGETTAHVEFEIRYADGTSKVSKVELTREAEQWRLGFVG